MKLSVFYKFRFKKVKLFVLVLCFVSVATRGQHVVWGETDRLAHKITEALEKKESVKVKELVRQFSLSTDFDRLMHKQENVLNAYFAKWAFIADVTGDDELKAVFIDEIVVDEATKNYYQWHFQNVMSGDVAIVIDYWTVRAYQIVGALRDDFTLFSRHLAESNWVIDYYQTLFGFQLRSEIDWLKQFQYCHLLPDTKKRVELSADSLLSLIEKHKSDKSEVHIPYDIIGVHFDSRNHNLGLKLNHGITKELLFTVDFLSHWHAENPTSQFYFEQTELNPVVEGARMRLNVMESSLNSGLPFRFYESAKKELLPREVYSKLCPTMRLNYLWCLNDYCMHHSWSKSSNVKPFLEEYFSKVEGDFLEERCLYSPKMYIEAWQSHVSGVKQKTIYALSRADRYHAKFFEDNLKELMLQEKLRDFWEAVFPSEIDIYDHRISQ